MRTRFAAAVCALLVALLAGLGPGASAQDKIDKPVRIVVGFAAAGTGTSSPV